MDWRPFNAFLRRSLAERHLAEVTLEEVDALREITMLGIRRRLKTILDVEVTDEELFGLIVTGGIQELNDLMQEAEAGL